MKNFLILIKYKVPIETVEEHTPAHREYLKEQYAKGLLLMSGPFVPRTAGVLWAQAEAREAIDQMTEGDPFFTNAVADFEIIEFKPIMHADSLNRLFAAQAAVRN
jgi:uncharacterized protein YciI